MKEDVEAGGKLVKELDEAGLPISAAMWVKTLPDDPWKLYIASPNVEKYGPTSVYKAIDNTIRNARLPLNVDYVSVANTSSHFVNNIAKGISPSSGVLRVTNSVFDELRIADAFIYKTSRNVKASRSPIEVRAKRRTG